MGDRLFLDANVLFSAAYRPDAGLLRLWKLSKAIVVSSAYAVEEARRNLDTPRQRDRLDALLRKVEVSTSQPADRTIGGLADLPAKDSPIMLAAIGAQATHLITGDYRHFGQHYGKLVEGVLITAPGDYLKSLA